MAPEQIAALTELSKIAVQIGTWLIGTLIVLIVLGPWVMLYLI